MNNTTLGIRKTAIAGLAAATLALAASIGLPGQVHAATTDEPWPEPPSCSNETLSCTSIADQLAYECFMEKGTDSPFTFCDDPFELMKGDLGLLAPKTDTSTAPVKLVPQTSTR